MIIQDGNGFPVNKSGVNLPDQSDAAGTQSRNGMRKVFGNNLRLYMRIKNLNQQDLAEQLEISPSNISRYVNGYAFPTQEHLDKICQILDVPISILYGESGNGRPVIRENQSFDRDSLLEGIVSLAISLDRNGQEKAYRYLLDLVEEQEERQEQDSGNKSKH